MDVRIVDDGFQQVDIVMANCAEKNDIIVTPDYGLAALVLSKKCHAISPRGMIYTVENMDNLLMLKHMVLLQNSWLRAKLIYLTNFI